ncbi:hypothetical protein Tco_0035601 [Tanacetum coccineum]
MPRDDPIIERIPRRSLKKRNITPSKNELPHIGSNVAFEENMISRFNIGIARRIGEIQSMRESVQGKPPHKHIDLSGDRFIQGKPQHQLGWFHSRDNLTSIWLWRLGDLSWPVAPGGDDMATWPVPTALPGIL